jgi:methylmalonyl-CoA epimerase
MHLEHLGIAVRNADATARLLQQLLGAVAYKSEAVESEGVRTVFLDAGGPKVELLEALHPDSPIARHVERRGEGLHHVAFEVPDLDAAFARLQAEGFRVLNDAPKRGADGKRIFFLHPKDTGGVLVELCQTAPPPLEPAFAPQGGGRIAYYQGGRPDAPPLLVLHGALGSTELETRRLLPSLEPHFRTVAVDFAAHGRSDDFEAEEPLTMEFFAENAVAVLDHLGLQRANVFGFSMGGAVALYLAHRHPERVGRMVVHGVNVRWDAGEVAVMTGGMDPESLAGLNPRWADGLQRAHGEGRWKALGARMVRFTQALPDRRFPDEALAAIAAPTLISHGDADRYFRLDHALHLWRTLPDAQLAVHPGLDHPIQGVHPARFAGMVRDFFLG